jgi:predicted GNAT family acetyltransferase
VSDACAARQTGGMSSPTSGTTKDGRTVAIARDDAGKRYTASVDGRIAALAEFIPTDELVVFTHTETDPSFEGQGVASQLVRWALDDVRARGLAVLPLCPFVKAYVGKHLDEYGDLVYTSRTTVVHD